MQAFGRRPKLIYFTASDQPTEEDMRNVETYAAKFSPIIRNAAHVKPTSSIENCQAVAGAVPALYAQSYPHADKYSAEKEPKIGTVRTNDLGHTVERIVSARDGTPADRLLFAEPQKGAPHFMPPQEAVKPWKPNA